MEEEEGVLEPPRIIRLEEAVVNRIAAGEVIQRPGSALKELMENSLDAGSTSISIVVKDGGLKLITITDNGHGIRHDDLPILCERHTTSKLREFEDLQQISTMGFRGEALASMSFVAHLTVTTMTADSPHGYRVGYKDGKMEGDPRPCAAVKGTQITVENLFYNVPARRKAFKNPGDEYSRVLEVVSRFAVHNNAIGFTCKKHGDSRVDIHTVPCGSSVEAIRSVYGPSVARELISVHVEENDPQGATFKMDGYVSSANYSAKRTTMVLFINDRMVECNALKKACEAVYAAILPKASKAFLYMSIKLPPQDVDVNVHPTKREVSFLNQESVVEGIQKAVETTLLQSNTSRTFYTQTLLPGVSAMPSAEDTIEGEELGTQRKTGTQISSQTQKAPEHKLVRTDESHPAGRLHAYLQPKSVQDPGNEPLGDLAATRRAVRQRRNPSENAELTSIQELLATVDQECHSGLLEIVKHCTFVGMADDILALIQHNTRLYLLNILSISKELMRQQVLRRFAHYQAMRLSNGAPLKEMLLMALDDEEKSGRLHSSNGDKEEIARLNAELLKCKSEMLQEYFSLNIDNNGLLHTLPLLLDHYTPDLDRLPSFVLALGNDVDWDSEKECFESLSLAFADFYALHPPLLERPNPDQRSTANGGGEEETIDARREQDEVSGEGTQAGISPRGESAKDESGEEAERLWAQREWTIQHLLFPALKFFLKPPIHMANDGTIVQVASLENLYKIFERC